MTHVTLFRNGASSQVHNFNIEFPNIPRSVKILIFWGFAGRAVLFCFVKPSEQMCLSDHFCQGLKMI